MIISSVRNWWAIEENMDLKVNSASNLWSNNANESKSNKSSTINFWKTNLQKQNVDEPEIIKLTKDYIAYYNKNQWKIYIISSPLDWDKLNLDKVKILDTIKIPNVIRKYSVKLFFVNDQLIVMWTRYSKAFGEYITDLVFYKIVNWKHKFLRLYDVKGNFKDARIVNDKVYLITDYNFGPIVNRICRNYFYNPIKDKLYKIYHDYDKKLKEEYKKPYQERNYEKIKSLREKLKKEIEVIYKAQKKNLSKDRIIKDLENVLKQKSIDIIFNKNAKFKLGNKIYPIDVRLVNSALNNILFVPTNFDKLNIYNLKFNIVNIVDLNTKENPNQYIIFWNMTAWEIHMTTKALYLVNNYYVDYPWSCRPGLLCILPVFPRWDFTLIHKLNLNWFNLDYINSQIIPWRPINQYSMDEDSKWNFRIFTKHFWPQRSTDLYIFDKDLNLVWKLQNIQPGEDFKASRFIEDKAYLVTFKATDPLFVIDLSDPKNPKIIGKLKIPWYSLYLHPYWKFWDKQYLIWIWQQAKEVYWNWSLPKNIKIDLYEIDFSKKSGDYINIKQKYSYILWKEEKVWNGWSYTPVFDNPRVFVWDKELKILLLPVYLTKDEVEKRCYQNRYCYSYW
jgi:uncharacterized secreted protein with C-terminal beta-propeller domain